MVLSLMDNLCFPYSFVENSASQRGVSGLEGLTWTSLIDFAAGSIVYLVGFLPAGEQRTVRNSCLVYTADVSGKRSGEQRCMAPELTVITPDPVIGTAGIKADMRYSGKTLKNRFQHDIW